MNSRLLRVSLALALVGIAAIAAAFADDPITAHYAVTELGYARRSGGFTSAGNSVDPAGHVVGSWQDSGYHAHAFYWTGSKLVTLPILPGTYGGSASAINVRRICVGYARDRNGNDHAVRWNRHRQPHDLRPPSGYVSAYASAINDAGIIAGAITPHGGTNQPAIWRKDPISGIGAWKVIKKENGYLVGINAAGD